MTFKTDDRVYETSVTTGTGTYTLDGAATGFQAFSAMSAGNDCPYFATDGTNWEVGIGGILSGPARLSRDVISSSNADAAVDWGAGTKHIRCGWPAFLSLPRTLTKSIAGSGTTVLTQNEQRRSVIEFTGLLTGNRTIEVDATPWDWRTVYNNTTGAYTLTFKVTGQTGVVIPQGSRKVLACNGTDVTEVTSLSGTTTGPFAGLINGTIVHTRGSSAETIAVKTLAGNDPSATDIVYAVIRDQAATTGGYVLRPITAALSITISSGSTLGAVNSVPFDVTTVIFDDGGTIRLGVINATYGLDGTTIASSTAEGAAGAADSANTFYTGTAVSSKPYCIAAISTFTLATVGTWGTAPSRIRLHGNGVDISTPTPMGFSYSVATTSGTSVDLATNIPSWAREVDITFAALSTNGTSSIIAQIGDGSYVTSGYTSGEYQFSNSYASSTAGFPIIGGTAAANAHSGTIRLVKNPNSNQWVASGSDNVSAAAAVVFAGEVTLTNALQRIRFTTAGGADTFDSGAAWITVKP